MNVRVRHPEALDLVHEMLVEDRGVSVADLNRALAGQKIKLCNSTVVNYRERAGIAIDNRVTVHDVVIKPGSPPRSRMAKTVLPNIMNRENKLRVRRSSKSVTADILKRPIKGNIISLPFVRIRETRKHFLGFPHVHPGRFYFFESDRGKFEEVSRAFSEASWRLNDISMLMGDMFSEDAVRVVPDDSVIVFDLDFMCALSDQLLKKVTALIRRKGHPRGFHLFVNTSYGRGMARSVSEEQHRRLENAVRCQEWRRDRTVTAATTTYKDTWPMMASTMVSRPAA